MGLRTVQKDHLEVTHFPILVLKIVLGVKQEWEQNKYTEVLETLVQRSLYKIHRKHLCAYSVAFASVYIKG